MESEEKFIGTFYCPEIAKKADAGAEKYDKPDAYLAPCIIEKVGDPDSIRFYEEGKVAVIEGVKELYGAKVRAPDLRGGAALAVAALSAEGETSLTNIKLMDRGYDCIENAFTLLGGNIKRVNY